MENESQISKFYAYKKILVTGGSGFMGKVLIWKLLQSCPMIGKIYVLLRSKRGKGAINRKEELFKCVIFDELKKKHPEVLEKVEIISGDVGEEGIGLSDVNRDLFINEISIIFHGAAILKMNADLKTAVNVNTEGTLRMLKLAEQMKNLETFVHVSTAYCCCENEQVEEKLYPAKHNPHDIMNLVRFMDPKLLDIITPNLIEPLPNTYTYTKRLTESLLQDFQSKLPIIVTRPTIVIPSIKEPIPGWNDTLNGPIGLFVAGGTGVLRISMIKEETVSNVIPVDIAVNGILVLPWANRKEKLLNEIAVYNIGQTEHGPIRWQDLEDFAIRSFYKYPYKNIFWYPNRNCCTENFLEYKIKSIFFHWIPAYIIDFFLWIFGQKPFLVNVHTRIQNGDNVLRFFTRREWSFANDKMLQLNGLLSEADKQIYPITMKGLTDFENYVDQMYLVTKYHLLKEDPNSLDYCRKKAKIMYCLDKIVLFLRYVLLAKILIAIFNKIFHLIETYHYQDQYTVNQTY